MKPRFFADADAFRNWLEKNHKHKKEILVGFYKTKTGKANMTWSDSVDQALCFGWIDGVRKSIDSSRYTIRFSPRKENSIWSLINIKKMKALTRKGLMEPAGQAIFAKRKKERSKLYSHENDPRKFDAELEQKFQAQEKAWKYFTSQAPSYQKVAIHWIMSAKKQPTRNSRLEKLIAASQAEKKLE
ncbi:MAG TPA: YdeI/OmpD-associated family protein [Chryseolinea sp.]|nr:YdeI/OmpD-associated family protein [Chryseolinea sp.]